MQNFDQLLELYNYHVPENLIAQEPASPRDSARLLVYNPAHDTATLDTFLHLEQYLPKNAVLVLNRTKVIPARLWVTKESGGKAQIFYISHDAQHIRAISDRKLTLGSTLTIRKDLTLRIERQDEQYYILRPSFNISKLLSILQKYGHTPLPPYIKHSPLSEAERREKYQSVFAQTGESVAAPTASLHFTKRLLAKLQRAGITIAYVNLNVGMGTFAPLKEENVTTGKLHEEFYEIDRRTAALLNKAKQNGRPIIPVGTTSLRTLESAAVSGKLSRLKGPTTLFIQEGYIFKFCDGLITNFHVPKSSLLMLVSAMVGREKLLQLYQKAISAGFKLFSFGDGMLILPRPIKIHKKGK